MTRRDNNDTIPPTLARITISNEFEILNKLRESQEDKQNGRTVSSKVAWSKLGFSSKYGK
ncbi:hypothetical protein HB943_07170 [Listeria weihenstephanensis]|uniref:Uncharacterized protein n=1 Tax=Listeria weihenstephanensis TaxID=1006155 RepID=A0A1S7FRS5_9LIST|nr:hypothetical protein [Listeria weihenstephanensis]AQY50077.1 hypothetical protein UE46_02785 [Listeria weihenstephanensis]MBC1500380.1 hypothetical protein [Listeria weihenstephanensis]